MFGDGFQNGGVLVVDKGGKTLHHYVQDGPADHEDNAKILNVRFRSNKRTDLQQVGDMNNLHQFQALGIHEATLHALNAITN